LIQSRHLLAEQYQLYHPSSQECIIGNSELLQTRYHIYFVTYCHATGP
jgi:hypothetical protein